MLLEQDVAEHHMRDAARRDIVEYTLEHIGVVLPRAATNKLRESKAPRLRRDGERAQEGSVADSALCPLRGDELESRDEVQRVTQQLLV